MIDVFKRMLAANNAKNLVLKYSMFSKTLGEKIFEMKNFEKKNHPILC